MRLDDFLDDFVQPKPLAAIFIVSGKSSWRISLALCLLCGLWVYWKEKVTAQSREMTYRGLANSGLWQAGIGLSPVSHLPASPNHGRWHTGAWPIPAYDKPDLACPQSVILLNLQRGFGEASSLKSSSGDKRFRLVVNRNWPGDPGPGKS